MGTRGPGALAPCGTPAACRRHYRRGEKPCAECMAANRRNVADRGGSTAAGTMTPDLRPARNGLPWRPYRYRGSGADAFTGEVVS